MNRREFLISTSVGMAGLSHVSDVASQPQTIAPNLGALVDDKSQKHFNRNVTRLVDGARNGVRLSEAPGEAVAFLPAMTSRPGRSSSTFAARTSGSGVSLVSRFTASTPPPTMRSTSAHQLQSHRPGEPQSRRSIPLAA